MELVLFTYVFLIIGRVHDRGHGKEAKEKEPRTHKKESNEGKGSKGKPKESMLGKQKGRNGNQRDAMGSKLET